MLISESQIISWAQAPSESEESSCKNASDSITSAIRSKFGSDVQVFLQGSYKNRTNVKKDSDVDIVVLHTGYYFPFDGFLKPEDKNLFQKNFVQSDYTFSNFKSELHNLLADKFGLGVVERKNKCLRVNGNSCRVNADVVPAFEYRRLKTPDSFGAVGIGFKTDSGELIDSYPNQHYQNGVDKNKSTNEKYKAVVRILKNIRNVLPAGSTGREIPSFLIESFVWNVYPHHHFEKYSLKDTTKSIISFVYEDMKNFDKFNEYAEVSDLKWLFRSSNHSPEQVLRFLENAWGYIEG